MNVGIEPLSKEHFSGLHAVFDAVCKEERFLAFCSAGAPEKTHAYYQSVISGGHSHFVALLDEEVIGWCDVLPLFGEMRAHCGVLGLGVAKNYRGHGVGRKLITAALAKASVRGIERVELTVRVDNIAAQSLYKSLGFVVEGLQHNAWRLRSEYFDVYQMARLQ